VARSPEPASAPSSGPLQELEFIDVPGTSRTRELGVRHRRSKPFVGPQLLAETLEQELERLYEAVTARGSAAAAQRLHTGARKATRIGAATRKQQPLDLFGGVAQEGFVDLVATQDDVVALVGDSERRFQRLPERALVLLARDEA
jgi:hypothetical protein